MVILAARLSPEEAAALKAAKKLTLRNIKAQRTTRVRMNSRSYYRRERDNEHSCRNVPAGFNQCPSASCDLLIPSQEFTENEVECAAGHITDLREIELQELLSPGGMALVGLTNTQQGQIAEQLVWDLHDLGEFGIVEEWLSEDCYTSVFDMTTSTGLPVEVRSVSTRAANHAFAIASAKKRRMDAEMRRRNAPGQLGVLVILDFVTMTADVYVRFMKRAIYFECPREAFVTGVPFTNPYAEPEFAMAGSSEEMPF